MVVDVGSVFARYAVNEKPRGDVLGSNHFIDELVINSAGSARPSR